MLDCKMVRLLIDINRDKLPKGSRTDYKLLSHAIRTLGFNISPDELRKKDKEFKNRLNLTLFFNKLERNKELDDEDYINEFEKGE